MEVYGAQVATLVPGSSLERVSTLRRVRDMFQNDIKTRKNPGANRRARAYYVCGLDMVMAKRVIWVWLTHKLTWL